MLHLEEEWIVSARHCVFIVIALLFSASVLAADGLTGSWHAEIALSPNQTNAFSAFQSTLDVGLSLSFLEVSSISDFLFEGWLWQEIDISAALSGVSFLGQMLFDPQTGSFLYGQGILSVELPPIRLSLYGAVVGPTQTDPSNYGYVFEIYGEILSGLLSIKSATFIGADLSGITFNAAASQTDSSLISKTFLTDPTIDTPPLGFSGQEVTLNALAFGCAELTSTTTFGKLGFESQLFELTFLQLFGIPLQLSVDFLYVMQTKSYVFTPSLATDYGCLSIYTTLLQTGSSTITGVEIYGIGFTCTFPGASITSVSNFNTTDYVITTPAFGFIVEPLSEAVTQGHLYYPQEYWEIVSIEVDIPPYGCGFSFSADTFFSTTSGLLFDWARTTMGVSLALGTSVTLSSTITVDTAGFDEWTITFDLVW